MLLPNFLQPKTNYPHWLTIADNTATINTKTDSYSPSYLARKIWTALYHLTNAHTFGDLDSFLCDLKVIEHFIFDGHLILFWDYDRRSGYTDIQTYNKRNPDTYQITILDNEINIAPAN